MYQDPNPKFAKQISQRFVRNMQTANGVPQNHLGTPKLNSCNSS